MRQVYLFVYFIHLGHNAKIFIIHYLKWRTLNLTHHYFDLRALTFSHTRLF